MGTELYDLIIRNGTIVTHERIFKADIGIKDQQIRAINSKFSPEVKAKEEVDATGKHIFPGLVDSHVHFNDPGRTEWEGLASGTRSLAAGGVTTFIDMPLNSSPVTVTVDAVKLKKAAADSSSLLDYGILGGLTPENIQSVKELKAAGVIGFKGFMSHSGLDEFPYFTDDEALLQGMHEVASADSVLFLHAENQTIINKLVATALAEGCTTIRDFVATRPVISEIAAVIKAAAFAEVTGCKTHIAHVSSGEISNYVTQAKKRGVDITVETCPHYLALNIEDFERIGALAKCCPPVREQNHVDSLWTAIADGEIDTVGSDHSPAPASLKVMNENSNIFKVWGGMSACQSTLNVMLEEGYFKRGVALETIVNVCAANPAKRFGLYPQKGTIAVGSDADLTLIDLNASFTLQKEDLFYHHPHSPYIGKKFRGTVTQTILRGTTVFKNGKIVSKPIGKHLRPSL